MKKWLVGYIILCLILLGIITFAGAGKSNTNTKFSKIYEETDVLVQSANNYYGNYILISTEKNGESAVRVDKGRENYQILDIVYQDNNVYFMYEYTPHLNKPVYGLGCYNLSDERLRTFDISELRDYKWLAFGVRDDAMYCLMNDIDNKQIAEFIVNTSEDSSWEIGQTINYPKGNYVVRAEYVDGNINICLDDGSAYYYKDMNVKYYEDISESPFGKYKDNLLDDSFEGVWKGKCVLNTFLTIVGVWLVVSVIGGLVVVGIAGRSSLVLRMFSIVELVLTVIVIVSSVVFAANSYKDAKTRIYDASEAGLIRLSDSIEIDGSISYEMLCEAAQNGNYPYAEIMVIKRDRNTTEVIKALMSPKTGADAALIKAIDRGNTYQDIHKSEMSFNGNVYLVTAVYQEQLSTDTLIVGFMDNSLVTSQYERYINRLYMESFAIWGCGTIVIVILYLVYSLRWKRFSDSLISIVRNTGDFNVPSKALGGLKREWTAIEEINHRLGKNYYEKLQDIEHYNRFVPRGYEAVLDKQSLYEVNVGDLREFVGNIATVSLDYADFNNADKYMETVSKNYEIIYDAVKDSNGVVVSQDSDFIESKIWFKDSITDAVKFSVDVLRRLRENAGMIDRNKLIIINSVICQSGILGCNDKAAPFLHYAGEEVFLKYIDALKMAGVQLVLTEKAVNSCTEKFSFRYIGYISDGDKNIKIYECLDVYPKFKKEILEKTHSKFKKAIGLFYSDDFYLARNAFNEVLKANPDDLIAKWYLFNCENNLNNTSDEQINYSLFGNKIHEQQYRI